MLSYQIWDLEAPWCMYPLVVRNTKMKKRTTILIFITVILISCSKTEPSNFWTEFDNELITSHQNDQGPWGGHRALHWIATNQNEFNSNKIIDFASKNGWTLVDSSKFKKDDVKSWIYINKPIFPLSHEGFKPKLPSTISTYNYFPRLITSDLSVFRFKTGWVSIVPGTNDTNEINGFVLINDKKNEMEVYHLWGE